MGSQGFKNIAGNPFVGQEDTRSAAFGLDAAAQKWKICVSSAAGALPTDTAQFSIDPATNGNVTIDPNGTGNLVLTSGNLEITAGHVLLPATTYGFTAGVLKIGTYKAVHMLGGNTNIWVGDEVANSRGTGFYQACTNNTGVGYNALGEIWVSSNYNTAIGANSMSQLGNPSNSGSGSGNTCVGYNTLAGADNDISYNTCIGYSVLSSSNVSAKYSTMIGYNSGSGVSGGQGQGSSCIYIMHAGTGGEKNKIRIGTQGTGNGQQDGCSIAGIYGVSVGATNGVVVIDNAHKLGSLSSLTAALGGTGLSTYAQGDILYASAANTLSALAKDANATRYLSNTGTSNNPAWAQIDLSNGVTGTLPPSAGGKMTWTTATADATAAVNTGYLIKHATPATKLTITLPATAALYSEIEIDGYTAGLWRLAQASGQTIHFGSIDTTTGTGGYLEATSKYDSVLIRCVVADTEFLVVRAQGTITIV